MAKTKRKLSAYNRHVQREMKKGKTMKQAAASWKKGGKRAKVKRVVKRVRSARAAQKARRRRTPSRTRRKTTGGSKVGKSGFNTQKLFKYLRLAALAAPAATFAMANLPADEKIARALSLYTGFNIKDGSFDGARLTKGYGPYLMSIVATYGIPKLAGIIRGL